MLGLACMHGFELTWSFLDFVNNVNNKLGIVILSFITIHHFSGSKARAVFRCVMWYSM
jgi:hypothetical protein